MENRGGTSIEELMRGGGQNSNMNDDDDVINSILSEINADKEQMVNNQQMQEQKMQQQQMQQKQQQQQQQMQRHQQMMKEQMMQEQMMKQKQMEIERMREQDKLRMEKSEVVNMCENVSLLDEFKSSIIFFIIFMLLNLTQINNLICGALSIENNNIFILLKTFVATVIFFFVNKLVHRYI